MFQAMTGFPEIKAALAEAVQTGKLGVPVSARVHLQLAEDASSDESPPTEKDWEALRSAVVELFSVCWNEAPETIHVRQHPTGRQHNTLLQTASGNTVCITIGRGCARQSTLHLLVLGNHGVVRLDGATVRCPGA